jgi:hypothetical protein
MAFGEFARWEDLQHQALLYSLKNPSNRSWASIAIARRRGTHILEMTVSQMAVGMSALRTGNPLLHEISRDC